MVCVIFNLLLHFHYPFFLYTAFLQRVGPIIGGRCCFSSAAKLAYSRSTLLEEICFPEGNAYSSVCKHNVALWSWGLYGSCYISSNCVGCSLCRWFHGPTKFQGSCWRSTVLMRLLTSNAGDIYGSLYWCIQVRQDGQINNLIRFRKSMSLIT